MYVQYIRVPSGDNTTFVGKILSCVYVWHVRNKQTHTKQVYVFNMDCIPQHTVKSNLHIKRNVQDLHIFLMCLLWMFMLTKNTWKGVYMWVVCTRTVHTFSGRSIVRKNGNSQTKHIVHNYRKNGRQTLSGKCPRRISGNKRNLPSGKFPPENFGKSEKLPVGKISPGVLLNTMLCFSIKMLSKRALQPRNAHIT